MLRHESTPLWSVIFLMVILAGGLIAIFILKEKLEASVAYREVNISLRSSGEEIETIESRILFGGDIFWGRQFDRHSDGDFNFPFSGLDTLERNNYDAWIANLECPITDEIVAFELQWEAIQFNCRPEFVKSAAEYFDVVSLANNHTNNVGGQSGLDKTRQYLNDSGIQYFGHYDSDKLEDICEIVTIKARVVYSNSQVDSHLLPIAMCGYHGVFRTWTDEELAQLKVYADKFITIAYPHAGAEYQPSSDKLRSTAYKKMIDNGADAVIASHPHWVQNTEVYKGKLIAYSLGNFIFDQQFSSEVQRSLLIDLTLQLELNQDIQAWLNIATKCATYKDDCLHLAEERDVAKLKAAFAYDAQVSKSVNFVAQKALDSVTQAVLERADWANSARKLNN